MPIRPEILQAERHTALNNLQLKDDLLTLLVFGGSRGARRINQAMVDVVREFGNSQSIQVIHATGQTGYDEFIKDCQNKGIDLDKYVNINIKAYLYNMHDALGAADLVVSSWCGNTGGIDGSWHTFDFDSLSLCLRKSSRIQCQGPRRSWGSGASQR
ncbi:hypothetical protein N752_09040 [Desulforamulus aquiferis]|nr:hypothetical protein N752_09040 [Desulforamulus aquiferis]